MTTPRWKAPKSGTCRVCGCTDEHACDGGCWWVDSSRTLCSTCSGTPADLAYALTSIAKLRAKPARHLAMTEAVALAQNALARFDARSRRMLARLERQHVRRLGSRKRAA